MPSGRHPQARKDEQLTSMCYNMAMTLEGGILEAPRPCPEANAHSAREALLIMT